LAGDEAVGFEFMEAGVEGAFFEGECAGGVFMDGSSDFVAVHGLSLQERKDKEGEGAFEEFRVHSG
jgi:hypothetical protein